MRAVKGIKASIHSPATVSKVVDQLRPSQISSSLRMNL